MKPDKTTEPNRKKLLPSQLKEKVKKADRKHRSLISIVDKGNIKEKHNEHLKFSFIYFDRAHKLFNCGRVEASWFIELVDHLREVSRLTKSEFLHDQKYKRHYETHRHPWGKLEHRYPLDETYFEQIKDECYQFRISSSKGRVHGFFILNIFYVVWLDPHHNLYPNDKFGGEKYYDVPQTSYEILEDHYNKALEEIKVYEGMLEELENENVRLKEALGQ